MHTRTLGNSDLQLSEIGLGCWQFGGDFGPITNDAVEDIISTALEHGVRFFDTADVYGAGRSESLLGHYFQEQSISPVIATKYGRGPGTYPDGYSMDNMRDAVRHAQDRLQCDCIDLLQLHCIPTQVLRRAEIFDQLRTVQQEGHIRYFGVSVETVEEGLICAEQDDLTSLQVIFNVFRQKLIDELFPVVREKNIGIIVRLPLASGLLTGKYSSDTEFDPSDHRNYNRDGEAFNVGETFAGLEFQTGLKLVEQLRTLLPDEPAMATTTMRWILDHPEVSAIIPGASSAKHAKANAAVSEQPPLPESLHKELKDFYQQQVAQHIRGPY